MLKAVKYSKYAILVYIVVLLLPGEVRAAIVTVGPSDCSAAAVNSAITSAGDGDTVELTCTGTQIWTTTVIIPDSKGITLKVQGGTNTPKGSASFPLIISSSADPIIQVNCENNRALNRVTGFKFKNTIASTDGAIFVQGRGTGTGGLGCFRIDNNYFDQIQMPYADLEGTITVWSSTGIMTGVIDNNTLQDCSWTDGYVISIEERWRTPTVSWPYAGQDAWTRSFDFASNDFIFIEDNLISNTTPGRYARHHIAAIQGAKYVARYNTFESSVTNGGVQAELVEAHGYCFCQSIGHGTRGGEIYQNIFQGTEVNNSVLLRGGTWLVYDNTWAAQPDGNFILLREYRAHSGGSGSCSQCDNSCPSDPDWVNCVVDASAYPMKEQIGADFQGLSEPSYMWNNLYLGVNRAPAVHSHTVIPDYIQSGRDFFQSDAKPAALSSYTPYTYPHPLRGEADTMPPAAPTGVVVSKAD
jgi:hypothetical protein